MTRQDRSWRIRVVFEPSRLSGEQLEKVYAQLRPTDARATLKSLSLETAAIKHIIAKRGGR